MSTAQGNAGDRPETSRDPATRGPKPAPAAGPKKTELTDEQLAAITGSKADKDHKFE